MARPIGSGRSRPCCGRSATRRRDCSFAAKLRRSSWRSPRSRSSALAPARGTARRSRGCSGASLRRPGSLVVSGLARGVDGEAHRGALEGGGATVAVLGCGVDRDYPAAHARARRDGSPPQGSSSPSTHRASSLRPWRFPARNRIVAGLAQATVVVEARERSGALITADFALEEGREVYACPGEITSALSAGTNALLRLGATPLTSSGDVLELFGLEAPAEAEVDLGETGPGDPRAARRSDDRRRARSGGGSRRRRGGGGALRARARGPRGDERRRLPADRAVSTIAAWRRTGSRSVRRRCRGPPSRACPKSRSSAAASRAARVRSRWPKRGSACGCTRRARSPAVRADATVASRCAVVRWRTTPPGSSSATTRRGRTGN